MPGELGERASRAVPVFRLSPPRAGGNDPQIVGEPLPLSDRHAKVRPGAVPPMRVLQQGQEPVHPKARLSDDRSERPDCRLSMHGLDHDPAVLGPQLDVDSRSLVCSKPLFRGAATTWAPETTGSAGLTPRVRWWR
jgi:hypothetical protein